MSRWQRGLRSVEETAARRLGGPLRWRWAPLSPFSCWALLSLAALVALAGCGGAAFRAVRQRPPEIVVGEAREIWIATDLTDSVSSRVAERLAASLRDLGPTRVVAVGRPPEAGVLVLSLALHRSVEQRPALVEQPAWCDPAMGCYTRSTSRIVDVPVVRVLVRLAAHDATGRVLVPPRVIERSQAGDDELTAEVRLVVRLSVELEGLFRPDAHEVSLEVLAVDDAAARRVVDEAMAAPSEDTCAAIEHAASRVRPPGERARLLHAAGQCHRVLAVQGEDEVHELARAEALYTAAMRLAPGEVYARALAETRAWLAQLRTSALRTRAPEVPEPPASYR